MDFTAKVPCKNPYIKANVFSKLLFWWVIPLLRKGKHKDMELEDLYDPLVDDLAGRLGDDFER